VILSRKGAKSTAGRKLRSTGTKAKGRVVSAHQSQEAVVKKLKAHARDLEKKLSEALEQQTATSEVLRVISSSPHELDPVFKTMLENATRLSEAQEASLVLREGDDFKIVTRYYSPATPLEPASCVRRSIKLKQVVQIPDIANDQAYFDREPARVRLVELGYRSQLSVPLIRDDEAIGTFNVYRLDCTTGISAGLAPLRMRPA
jgi:two-component system, NtrC family, sensor kinase